MKIYRPDLATYFKQECAGYGDLKTAFRDALRRGDVTSIESVLKSGFDIHSENVVLLALTEPPDYTVMNSEPSSIGYNRIPHRNAVVQLLFAHGADIRKWEKADPAVLFNADDSDLIRMLVSHGANPNAQNGGGADLTPLHAMTRIANVDPVRALLKAGADPNLLKQQPAKALLESSLDAALFGPHDGRPADGGPPDFNGEGVRLLEIVRLLVKAGADTTKYRSWIHINRYNSSDSTFGYLDFEKRALQIMREESRAQRGH